MEERSAALFCWIMGALVLGIAIWAQGCPWTIRPILFAIAAFLGLAGWKNLE